MYQIVLFVTRKNLGSLEIKMLVDYWANYINDNTWNNLFKMNEVIEKSLLNGYKFMPELHLRQPRFTYSCCWPFTKHHERIQKIKETGNLNYIYKNEFDKACFTHDAAYSNSKDLAKRTISGMILKGRAYEIAINPKYDGYQRGLATMVYIFFDKKARSGKTNKKRARFNEVCTQELPVKNQRLKI